MPRAYRPDPDARFVDANGLRFGYLEWGQGPLVLLFHGFPDTARTWDRVGPALAQAGYRAVAPFQRGYAPTQLPPRDADGRALAEDALALVGALGAHKARLVGHDWGAEGVLGAAALGPERVERLVTIAIPHRAVVRPTPGMAWKLRHSFALQLPGGQRRFARDDFRGVEQLWRRWSPTWRFTAEDLEPVKNAFASPGCLDAAVGYYRAVSLSTPPYLKPPIAVPTLAFAGRDDPSVRPELYERARPHYRAGYQVRAIPGGHFCHRESPEALLAELVPFLG